MRKGHLINCINMKEVNSFNEDGYVGVGPFYPDSSVNDRKIGTRLRIVWDVIADLKRAKPGDICFLHSEGKIFGPYMLTSTFKESASMPPILQSSNITYDNWITNKSQFDEIVMDEYGYVASIQKPRGCNDSGIDLMDLFLNQSRGLFNGIPPRFMYGETKKIVKPLLYHELVQLFEMVNFNDDWSPINTTPYQTNQLSDISLDLSDYNNKLYCEKLLEAWFMESMFPDTAENSAFKEIQSIIGNFNYYSNCTYTYYTNFLDVLAYDIDDKHYLSCCEKCNNINRDFAENIKIIELKRDYIRNPSSVVYQVEAYMRWARTVLNPNASVSGYIVTAGYGRELQSVKASNPHITFIKYNISGNGLSLEEV